jgi:hypothetical protein
MSEETKINIFDKGEELKYAPYWTMIERHLDLVTSKKNIRELLEAVISENTSKLFRILSHLIGAEDARELSSGFHDAAVEIAVEIPNIKDEHLVDILGGGIDEILEPLNDHDNIELVKDLINDYIANFIKLKKGADVFWDLIFSNSIITERLEDEFNIPSLFYFMSKISAASLFVTFEEFKKQYGVGMEI